VAYVFLARACPSFRRIYSFIRRFDDLLIPRFDDLLDKLIERNISTSFVPSSSNTRSIRTTSSSRGFGNHITASSAFVTLVLALLTYCWI
jgi:hypothetical protein